MFIDLETKNLSFLQVSKKLKDKGIKDYVFMLKTIDDDLKGVDPFDENLSDELKEKIEKECTDNIWYFLREVVRIPCENNQIPFILTLASAAQIYTDLNHVKTITLIPRQFGKTLTECTFGLWLSLFQGKEVVVKGADNWRSKCLKNYILNIKSCLPKYLNKKIKITVYSKKEENRYFDCMLILDDVAFMRGIKDVKFDASMIISMTTVPSIIQRGNAAEFIYKLASFGVLWDDRCYDYDPINFKGVGNKYVVIRYGYQDLLQEGIDPEKWLEEQKKVLWDGDLFEREILCKWPISKNVNGGR